VRTSLLAEHTGSSGDSLRRLEEIDGLIAYLDQLAESPDSRLCHYLPESSMENGWSEVLEPVAHVVDPEKPLDDEFIFEYLAKPDRSLFAKGIMILSQWVAAI